MRSSRETNAKLERRPVLIVVEDELLIRMMISDHLRDEGFTVIEAGTTDEALQVIAAGLEVEDLVFTDVRLPGELDGLELAERLLNDDPNRPVIVTSGHLLPENLGGVAPFIPKPYVPDAVVKLIREIWALRLPARGCGG